MAGDRPSSTENLLGLLHLGLNLVDRGVFRVIQGILNLLIYRVDLLLDDRFLGICICRSLDFDWVFVLQRGQVRPLKLGLLVCQRLGSSCSYARQLVDVPIPMALWTMWCVIWKLVFGVSHRLVQLWQIVLSLRCVKNWMHKLELFWLDLFFMRLSYLLWHDLHGLGIKSGVLTWFWNLIWKHWQVQRHLFILMKLFGA